MTTPQSPSLLTVEQIAEQAYAAIAAVYPICAASDEFYFFPQVSTDAKNWRVWDDFSAATIEAFADRLRGWEVSLDRLLEAGGGAVIDCDLLQATLRTLREQLTDMAPHRQQPTFHLTVVVAGLAEALETQDAAVWAERVAGLPGFLQRAAASLERIPRLFFEAGVSMLADLRAWLAQLQASGMPVGDAPAALELFAAALYVVPVVEEFTLSEEQFGRLVRDHFCCGLDPDMLRRELQAELAEMDEVLCGETIRLAPARFWQELEDAIPFVAVPGGDLLELYRPELARQEAHVRRVGLIPEELGVSLKPELVAVPEVLAAVRASDAYSARPGHPARGGTFSVYSRDEQRGDMVRRTQGYRMTAAHETWPGHHLLDVCRWSLPYPVRRPVERPLRYEGWACLAEELMARTGYFESPWDRFLLARRRIERAARGLIDIGLQTGRMNLEQAVDLLVQVGFPRKRAEAVVPKYLLRPGYQVCYTWGLRQNLDLLARFGADDPAAFARTLLRQGQIDHHHLEVILFEEDERRQKTETGEV